MLISGAIDSEMNSQLTVLGKKMSAFPIDPKYSKVLLSAPEFHCLEEVMVFASLHFVYQNTIKSETDSVRGERARERERERKPT